MPESRSLPQIALGCVSRHVADGIIVVDTVTQQAHALEGDLAVVWAALESGLSPELPVERVDQAIAALRAGGLLADPTGLSRRTVLKAGATGVAVVGLTSLALPALALAASVHDDETSGGAAAFSTITIATGHTAYIAMVGGGGAGGTVGAGGAGTTLYVTIVNSSGVNPLNVYGYAGGGGTFGTGTGTGVGGKVNNLSTAYAGGPQGGDDGGAGGGASVLTLSTATTGTATAQWDGSAEVLVIAGGGGGGGSANGANGNGSRNSGGGTGTVGDTGTTSRGAGGGGIVGGSDGSMTGYGGASGSSTTTATNQPTGVTITVSTTEFTTPASAVTHANGITAYGASVAAGANGSSGAVLADVI